MTASDIETEIMKFRTEISIPAAPFRISPEKRGVLLGSCFSDEIGARMRNALWDVLPNPCGTLFNPLSIARAIRIALATESQSAIRFAHRPPLWHSWDFSTLFSDPSEERCRRRCLEALDLLTLYLSSASFLAVTFGTAMIYTLEGVPVANCHKYPQSTFERGMCSVEEIVQEWKNILSLLWEKNPDIKVIFTISPVRHVADTLPVNSLSKATLRLAVEQLASWAEAKGRTFYFPAYEIMIDDLRDYRFYASDMVHPSSTAVDYVWRHFQACLLTEKDRAIISAGESLRKRLTHRPLIEGIDDTDFRTKTAEKLEAFLSAHPGMRP
ncbi:MAG: GSCFA domain-containing protein [Bacteroidales bacterium]|nr:GSCFA domain-containing protein [Bacteroidales bacterium]